MSAITSTVIDTLGSVKINVEYTDSSVNGFWQGNVNQIYNVFSQGSVVQHADPLQDPAVLLWQAVQNLKQAATNGIDSATGLPVPNGGQPTGNRYYLTAIMANSLDQLIRSLESSGFDTQGVASLLDRPQGINAVNRWIDLGNVGLSKIILDMENAVGQNRSLQALLELQYVRTGNDTIGANLQGLHDALTLNEQAMRYLTDAQNLKNKLTPDPTARGVIAFSSMLGTDGDPRSGMVREFILAWLFEYNTPRAVLNDMQNTDINLQMNIPNVGDVNWRDSNGVLRPVTRKQFAMSLLGQIGQLRTYFLARNSADAHTGFDNQDSINHALGQRFDAAYKFWMEIAFKNPIGVLDNTQINPSTGDVAGAHIATDISKFQEIQSNLASVYSQLQVKFAGLPPSQQPELMTRIQQVLDDMNAGGGPDGNVNMKLFTWIQDTYSAADVTTAGTFQTHLTQCITAAQSLNDTQKQNLQNYLYVFQQFYTSASAMLNSITSIITKMAGNIKG